MDKWPAWSPSGNRIVYVHFSSGSSSVYIVGSHGSNPHEIHAAGTDFLFPPAWSPNGTRIAFSQNVGGFMDIFTIKPDGSGLQSVTTTAGVSELFVDWAPDGDRISVNKNTASGWKLLTMQPDASHMRRVGVTTNMTPFGFYTPDGSRLVYDRPSGPGGTQEIHSIRLDGSGKRRLTDNAANDFVAYVP